MNRCTARGCRTKIKDGSGIQWLDEKGEWERYCIHCYAEMTGTEDHLNDAMAEKKEEERSDA